MCWWEVGQVGVSTQWPGGLYKYGNMPRALQQGGAVGGRVQATQHHPLAQAKVGQLLGVAWDRKSNRA